MEKHDILNNAAYDGFFTCCGAQCRRPFATFEGEKRIIHYIEQPKGVRLIDYGVAEFTMYAPKADTVSLKSNFVENGECAMKRAENGYWQVRLDHIRPGLHSCTFLINGVPSINPRMPAGYSGFSITNFFDMPDEDASFYLEQPVAHGTIRCESYFSAILGQTMRCLIYTPPGYEDSGKQYPVMYMLHGGGENETAWLQQGKLHYIADNLFAENAVEEMILVMVNGYVFTDREDEDSSYGSIDDVIAKECVPFIDSRYRTIRDRHARAVAGLSMGGFQSNACGMKHSDLFANVGVFSGDVTINGVGYDMHETFENAKRFTQTYDLFFVAYGEKEQPSCDRTRELCRYYQALGSDMHFYSCDGAHEWYVWRKAIREMMRMLFKKAR
jgi:enterochelin esterase-like enzyme